MLDLVHKCRSNLININSTYRENLIQKKFEAFSAPRNFKLWLIRFTPQVTYIHSIMLMKLQKGEENKERNERRYLPLLPLPFLMFLQWSIAAYFTAACSSFFVFLPSFSTVLKIMSVITFGAFTILERSFTFSRSLSPLAARRKSRQRDGRKRILSKERSPLESSPERRLETFAWMQTRGSQLFRKKGRRPVLSSQSHVPWLFKCWCKPRVSPVFRVFSKT